MNTDRAEAIHRASLSLLDNPGVKVEHDDIFDRLIKSGAAKGIDSGVIRFPSRMVDEYLDLCPRTVEYADRRGSIVVFERGGGRAIWSTPGLYIADGRDRRDFTSEDMIRYARLLDRLDEVHGVFGVTLHDVEVSRRDSEALRLIAENTTKHIRAFCFSADGVRRMTEMRAVVSDSPWFSIGFTAHGPLRWTNLALSIFQATAGHGIPVTVNGEPMAGVSGPVTLAGSAAVGNAEILAGIVINQLLEPGRPCVHNLGLAHVFDMRHATACTGAPENIMLAELGAELGRFYGLPSASWVSTESKIADGQASLEKSIGFLAHMRAGINNIWGVGQLESEMTVSPVQAVIDNEIIAYCRRMERYALTEDEDLALDAIRDVGIAGSFLDHPHTIERYRQELFEPTVLSRDTRESWFASGSPDLAERARARAGQLLADESEPTLSAEQKKELKRISLGSL